MGMIISIINQKGGVAKSTVAINLASVFAQYSKVAILDTDVQGSLTQVVEDNENLHIIQVNNLTELKTLDYQVIVVDTPPYLSNQLPQLISISDFIIVPTKAGVLDSLALKATVALIKSSIGALPVKWGVLFTMVNTSSKVIDEIKVFLEQMEVPIMKSIVTQRVSYVRSIIDGGILKSNDLKAKSEIILLAEEIVNELEN